MKDCSGSTLVAFLISYTQDYGQTQAKQNMHISLMFLEYFYYSLMQGASASRLIMYAATKVAFSDLNGIG